MKKFAIVLFILALIILVGAGLVFISSRWQNYNQPTSLNIPEETSVDNTASSTDIASSTPVIPTVDTSAWKKFSSDEIGYEISYPADLIYNAHGTSLILAFPQKTYFHWPLLDDSKVTITVNPKCPKNNIALPLDGSGSTTANIGGQTFSKFSGSDVGAGNVYFETLYQSVVNGNCYQLDLYEHGANGAGLYVSDTDLIKKYDAQHSIDKANLNSIMDAMVQSFKIKSIPVGIPEDKVGKIR